MSTSIDAAVRERYGEAARAASQGKGGGCCGGGCGADPITTNLYDAGDIAGIPDEVLRASLGCGNPTLLADLHAGEVVLDLGSGGGIDVLLSARRVGPTGFAYGVDMTDEMLALARRNQLASGVSNAEFLHGSIEALPLPDAHVDVIVSNCVVNLAGDKRAVAREAFRVLRPGGRLAISDIVTRTPLADAVGASMPLWTSCVAGAMHDGDLTAILEDAGFTDVSLESTREYSLDDARAMLADAGLDADRWAPGLAGEVYSAFIRATKP